MWIGGFFGLLKATAIEWWNDNTFRLSASLAFYTVFSLAPMLLIAIWIAELVVENPSEAIVAQFEQLIGANGARAVADVAAGFDRSRQESATAAIVGLVTLLIGSTVVFAELQAALNQIWDVQSDPKTSVIRSLLRVRVRSFAVVLGVGFLLLVSLVLSTAIAAAQAWVRDYYASVGWVWQGVNLLVTFVLVGALFAMIYKYLPDVKITWRDVAIGAAVTSLLFSIGKFLIGLYLGQAAPGSAYGAAGSFAVLLIWVYYSALISFFGAEFTQVYARRYGSKIHPEPHAIRVGDKPDEV